MQTADQVLLERWRAEGDAAAFREITARYAGLVYAAAKRVLKDASDAEDVAQECFEALALRRDAAPTYLGSWLHTVATNRALNYLDSAQRRRAREQRAAAATPEYTRTEWDDLYEHVDAAIAELPTDLQSAIVGHFLEGQSKADLARALGVSRPAIHYRIDKGLEQVRHALRRKGVTASASVFGAAMAAQASEVPPGSLVAGLGKIAMTGVSALGHSASPIVATTIVGSILMKKLLISVAAVIAIAGGLGVALRDQAPAMAEPPDTMQAESPAVTLADEIAKNTSDAPAQPAIEVAPVSRELHPPEGYSDGEALAGENPYHGDLAITGRVVDRRGNSIQGAYVTLVWANRMGYTERDGSFRLEGLSSEPHFGFARHENFSDKNFGVDAGDENVLIVLEDRATISGRVVDARTGSAVSSFTIMSQSGLEQKIQPGLMDDKQSVFDPRGLFKLEKVKVGENTLIVEAEGYAPSFTELRLDSSEPVTDIVVEIHPGVSVDGVVTNSTGSPVAGAWLFSETPPPVSDLKLLAAGKRQHLAEYIVCTSEDSGIFSVRNLRGDEAALYAFHPEHGFGKAPLEWTKAVPLRGVNIVLENLEDLTGSAEVLVTINGEPAGGAEVFASAPGGRYTIFQRATTGTDGRATLAELPTGAIGVWAPYPGLRRYTHKIVVDTEIEKGKTADVQIEFAPATATLEGRVRLGDQIPRGYHLELGLEESGKTESFDKPALLDGGGFRFEDIVPGEGSLLVSASFGGLPRVKSIPVNVIEGESQPLDIDFGGGGAVGGTVTGIPQGTHAAIYVLRGEQVIADIAASLHPSLQAFQEGATEVEPDGSYIVEGIAPDRHTVHLQLMKRMGLESNVDARFATSVVDVVEDETAIVDFDVSE